MPCPLSQCSLLEFFTFKVIPSLYFPRYNVIFRFLFGVKRTQLDLQSLWAMQMVRKRSKDNRNQRTVATWSLRRKMAFLVDNLQYYLQVVFRISLRYRLSLQAFFGYSQTDMILIIPGFYGSCVIRNVCIDFSCFPEFDHFVPL